MSSLEFKQDTGKARMLAENEPVFILDRGEASHVLLSIGEYRKLAGRATGPSDDSAKGTDMDFSPSKMGEGDFRTVEFD